MNVNILSALLLFSSLFSSSLWAVSGKEKFKPYLEYHQLKKEKGKYGVWSKIESKWVAEPIYDSVTPVLFYDSIWGVKQNLSMNKFWQNGKFDLLINYRYDDPKDFSISTFKKQVYEVKTAIKGIDDFIVVDKNKSELRYNIVFSIAYKRNNKWGWYARLNRGRKYNDYLGEASFDDIPLITESTVHGISSGMHCLYTLENKELAPCGSFVKKYDTMNLTILENAAGLKGFIGLDQVVLPRYASIEEQNYATSYRIEYLYKCFYPDGTMDAYRNFGLAKQSDVEFFESSKAYAEGWKDRLAVERQIINNTLMFFCGTNGLGVKTAKGELLLYPALQSFAIGNTKYYCTAQGVGCSKYGKAESLAPADTVHCNLPENEYNLNNIVVKYGREDDKVFHVKSIGELKPEGVYKIEKCNRCGGDGKEQVSEKVIVKAAETKSTTKTCYSCGDVVVKDGTLTKVYNQTYTESYTIPEITKTEYHDITCTKCLGKGKIQIGYRYNPDKKIYE